MSANMAPASDPESGAKRLLSAAHPLMKVQRRPTTVCKFSKTKHEGSVRANNLQLNLQPGDDDYEFM